MGKLRTEPKHKSFLTQEQFEEYAHILKEAQNAADDNHVFWDLEPGEKASKIRKAFVYVAEKQGINVTIRQVRGKDSLAFYFRKGGAAAPGAGRMSAQESKNRILKCLKSARKPLKKNQIIKETGISPSTWNIRIKELLEDNEVARQGNRRDTTYTIKD